MRNNAFLESSIIAVNIPASVTNISGRSFSGCTQLKTITFAAGSRLSYLGNGTFNGCTSLESISIPGTVGVVNSLLFNGCTSLESVELGEGITGIADSSTAYLVFGGCTSLREVKLPSTLTHIGDYAFYQCTALASIDIPDDVTYIGKDAFERCYALTEIVLPDGITAIADNTFQNCTSLTSVAIPDTVISIGNSAFGGCSALMSFTVPQDMETIGTSAFAGCSKLVEVINKSTLEIVKGATTYGGIAQNAVSVHSGDTSLIKQSGDYSFMADGEDWFLIGYTGNENNITLPSAVDGHSYDIFDSAFVGSEVEEVVIPEGVTSIGEKAFYGSKLKKVTLPASLETIGVQAFGNSGTGDSWTPYLKTVVFSDSGHSKLSSIGNSAFRSAPIKSISIPGAAAIDGYAFQNCTELITVSLGAATSIGTYAFSGCTSLRSIDIPDSVLSLGERAFSECSQLVFANIGDDSKMTSIGNYAFYNCYSLVRITIPKGVTQIGTSSYGANVFYYCHELLEVKNLSNISISTGNSSNGYVGNYAEHIYNASSADGSYISQDNDGFIWYKSDSKHRLIGYVGNDTELTLAATHDGAAYEIYKYAFYKNTALKQVIIPAGFKNTGDQAFGSCSNLVLVVADTSKDTSWSYNWNSGVKLTLFGSTGEKTTFTFVHAKGDGTEEKLFEYTDVLYVDGALPTPDVDEGYHFMGWYDGSDFSTAKKITSSNYSDASKNKLYARIINDEEYDNEMRDGSDWHKELKAKLGENTSPNRTGSINVYWLFTPVEDGSYTITVDSGTQPYRIRVYTEQTTSDDACIGQVQTTSSTGNATVTVNLAAGTTYYFTTNYVNWNGSGVRKVTITKN